MDSEGGGAEGFQGSFCFLFCCYHLMAVTTADPICTAAPIFLISQPASLPTFTTLDRIAGMEPTSFSPSPLSPSLHNIQHKIFRPHMFSTCPYCLMLSPSLKGKKLLRCHTEMIPWTADFATSVAGVRAMILRRECASVGALVLNAYKECPVQDQEDRRHDLRR